MPATVLQAGEISGEPRVEIIGRVHLSNWGGDVAGVAADGRIKLNTGQTACVETCVSQRQAPCRIELESASVWVHCAESLQFDLEPKTTVTETMRFSPIPTPIWRAHPRCQDSLYTRPIGDLLLYGRAPNVKQEVSCNPKQQVTAAISITCEQ